MQMPKIVGVLNVTPDSFHDGGKFNEIDAAVAQAERLLREGADIIDAGGESTGPKSPNVSEADEAARVLPVIKAIHAAHPTAAISIDTYKASIAEQAVAAGATMINDVTAGRGDPAMFSIIKKTNVPVVLMYSKDATPRTTIDMRQYDDVIGTVKAFLQERIDAAVAAGIDKKNIIVDPGLGHFISSDPAYSFDVLARLHEFASLGCRIYVSPSRKSFVAGPENLKTIERLPGTIAASVVALQNGASFIRTHDVLDVRRACKIADLIRRRSGE
jgi:dihydropteroate synthase